MELETNPPKLASNNKSYGLGARLLKTISIGLTTLAVASAVPLSTSASYTDSVYVSVTEKAGIVSASAQWTPQQTYAAGTSVALQDDGSIAIWGYRYAGMSGTGADSVSPLSPVSLISLPNDGYSSPGARRAVKVQGTSLDNFYPGSTNYSGLAALSDDGRIYTWGGNQNQGVMGRPSVDGGWRTPGLVDLPGRVVDLASSSSVFMALLEDGSVYTWGYNWLSRGLLGRGITESISSSKEGKPQKVDLPGPAHSIGAGNWSSWAIVGNYEPGNDKTGVFWWGWANTQTFQASPGGDPGDSTQAAPHRSATLSTYADKGCDGGPVGPNSSVVDKCGIVSMSGHYYGNEFLLSNGEVLSWGAYDDIWGNGGLGFEAADARAAATPTRVSLAEGVKAVAVASLEEIVLVLGDDGYLYQWGGRKYGAIDSAGNFGRSNTPIKTPQKLTSLGNKFTGVGGSGYTPMAVEGGSHMWSWNGSIQGANVNTYAQVRNSFQSSSTPTGRSSGPIVMEMPGAIR